MPRATQAEPDVREVRKEEIEQLLVPGLVPRDLAVDDGATEAERLEAARNVYAANLSAAPSYPRLAKFTIQTSQPSALEPRSVFGRLQTHLQRQFGIALSDDDVRTLVGAPLGQRSGERDSRADLERDRGMLAALGRKLAQDARARDVPIVRALTADIAANLAELDEALEAGDGQGPSVQPPSGGGRRRRVGFNV